MVMNKNNKKSGKSDQRNEEDRRIRRTKTQLKKALTELVLEKGYDEVSVQEIIDRADVGRTSFYTYFRNKEDLLLQNLDDLEGMFDEAEKVGEQEGMLHDDFTLHMFQHLKENWRLGKILLGNKKIPLVRNYVQNILLKYYRKRYKEFYKDMRSELEIEGAAVFTSGALLSLTLWWLGMSRPVPPEKMHKIFLNEVRRSSSN